MEETKQKIDRLYKIRRLEIWLAAVLALFGGWNIYQAFTNDCNCRSDITVETQRKQIEHLTKQNTELNGLAQTLTKAISERNERDSLTYAKIAANDKLLPAINARLNQIDKNYEKTINAVRSYDDAEMRGYLSNNAARERRMGGQGRTTNIDTQQRTRDTGAKDQ